MSLSWNFHSFRLIQFSFAFLAIVFIGLQAHSEEITIDFEGKVDYVGPQLLSAIERSQNISGSYTFDAQAPDRISSGTVGFYPFTSLTFGNKELTVSSDGTDIGSGILIIGSNPLMDIYDLQAYGDLVGSEIDGYKPWSLRIYLVFSGDKFSNDSLPISAFSLSDAKTADFELVFTREASFTSLDGRMTSLRTR